VDPYGLCPSGAGIVVIFDKDAKLPVTGINVGHPGILIGSDTKGWHYFSFHGGESLISINGAIDNLEATTFNTLKEAFESGDLKDYDEFAYWKRGDGQIKNAYDTAIGWYNKGYYLTGYNCEDMVGAAAIAAGINWTDKFWPTDSWKINQPKADICGKIERNGK
jgi:hypothetical protein